MTKHGMVFSEKIILYIIVRGNKWLEMNAFHFNRQPIPSKLFNFFLVKMEKKVLKLFPNGYLLASSLDLQKYDQTIFNNLQKFPCHLSFLWRKKPPSSFDGLILSNLWFKIYYLQCWENIHNNVFDRNILFLINASRFFIIWPPTWKETGFNFESKNVE